MSLNYVTLQAQSKAVLIAAGAIPCTIRWIDNSTAPSFALFIGGTAQNIDNRSNPTPIGGIVAGTVYLPGDLGWTPEITGTLEWGAGAAKQVKSIMSVAVLQPSTVPLLYTLVVA
jgi:hypothetical protein